jgi:hypothetical protein
MHPMRRLQAGDLYATTLGSVERRWTPHGAARLHVVLSRDATVNRLSLVTLRASDQTITLHDDTLRTGEMPQLLLEAAACC